MREIKTVSPSSISAHDECERKWWFSYVYGIKAPQKASAALGDGCHKVLEKYLETGERPDPKTQIGSIVLAGMPKYGFEKELESSSIVSLTPENKKIIEPGILPEPGSVFVEVNMTDHPANDMVLHGWKVSGRIDVLGVKFDPIIVEDHKTTSSLEYAKTPEQLMEDNQSIIYGNFAIRYTDYMEFTPSDPGVKFSHNVFLTRGMPRALKTSVYLSRPYLHAQLKVVANKVERMRETAKKTKPSEVEPNLSACDMYGGCFFRDKCKALGSFGRPLEGLLNRQKAQQKTFPSQEIPMSALDKLKQMKDAAAAAAASAAAAAATQMKTPTAAPAPAPAMTVAEKLAQMKAQSTTAAPAPAATTAAPAPAASDLLAKLKADAAAKSASAAPAVGVVPPDAPSSTAAVALQPSQPAQTPTPQPSQPAANTQPTAAEPTPRAGCTIVSLRPDDWRAYDEAGNAINNVDGKPRFPSKEAAVAATQHPIAAGQPAAAVATQQPAAVAATPQAAAPAPASPTPPAAKTERRPKKYQEKLTALGYPQIDIDRLTAPQMHEILGDDENAAIPFAQFGGIDADGRVIVVDADKKEYVEDERTQAINALVAAGVGDVEDFADLTMDQLDELVAEIPKAENPVVEQAAEVTLKDLIGTGTLASPSVPVPNAPAQPTFVEMFALLPVDVQTQLAGELFRIASEKADAVLGTALAQPQPEGLFLYIDCAPERGFSAPVQYLENILAPYMAETCKHLGAPHYSLVEYGKGPGYVAAQLLENPPTGVIVCDTHFPATKAALEVLLPRATAVVRG